MIGSIRALSAALLVAGLMLGLGGGLSPAAATEPPNPAIRDTIRGQLDAFLAGNIDEAWDYATPDIQTLFGTPDRFADMVRDGYPMVWQPGKTRFGPLIRDNGALWQQIVVADLTGRSHVLRYRMEQIDGRWRIAAVMILPKRDLNV